ncbi:MAG: DUF5597 domain-containing protein [Lachnospiraceae bacterium]|nr:DUF5597 domain-containing protein [Lachnospiraceae bacterium]
MKKELPEIRDLNGIPTFFVDGEPFFAMGGELHNSSVSSNDYMDKNVWPNLLGLNMNTVVAPVYWEMLEKEEGVFDFSIVEHLLKRAREYDMHVVILWFGLWKNSESNYIPGWMKKDREKYFVVRKDTGEPLNIISAVCEEAVEKDAYAFSQLMKYLKEEDGEETTVIAMQIENEIGILGSARDYGKRANELFEAAVPADLAERFGVSGTWKEAFGADAEEYFMAYHYASAIEKITAAGREEYPIPCYANVWLRQFPWYAGSYPSGGPVREVHDIWKLKAPSLFTIGPDIYVSYAPFVMDEYHYEGNPLFIPEIRKDASCASYCLYAFGKHNALCFSPFGIEDLKADKSEMQGPDPSVLAELNIDPAAFDTTGTDIYLSQAYGFMNDIMPLYLQYRGTDHFKCYLKKAETERGEYFRFENYDLLVTYFRPQPHKPAPAGFIFELAPDRFLICGMMSRIKFFAKEGGGKKAGFINIEEGSFVNGQWTPGRIMNGDERMDVSFGGNIRCFMAELGDY